MQQGLLEAGTLQPLLALTLSSLIVMGSPGPATVSVTAVGAAFGFRRSVPYLAGVICGTTAVLIVVATGLASLLLSRPSLAPALVTLAAAYIFYLAYRIATAPPLAGIGRQANPPIFLGGLLLAVANPKAYVAIAAVFAGTRLNSVSQVSETLIKIALLTAMIVLIHIAWLGAGASFARLLYRPLISRVVNLFFAATLVLSMLVPLFG